MRVWLGLAVLCLADDREDLLSAVRKTAEAASYTFRIETRVDTTFGKAPREIPVVDGKFDKDVGLALKVGDRAEIFRKDQKTYAKPTGQENWREVWGYPYGGAAGDVPPPAGQPQGPVRGGGDRVQLFGRMMIRNLKPPHEEILTFEKGLKEVKKAELTEKVGELECVIYAGDFTDEAMKDSPFARMFNQFGVADPGMTGRLRAWIDPKSGTLPRYEITTSVSVEFQGNIFEVSTARTITLSDSGRTKVEVPEGLRRLLGERSEDPNKDQKKPNF